MLQQIGFHGDPVAYPELRHCTLADLIARAEGEIAGGVAGASAMLYKGWIASHPDDPWLHAAYFNYGVALSRSGDQLGAINANHECLRLKPDFHPPYINLGRLLEDTGRAGEAVARWRDLVDRLKDVNGDAIRNKLVALEQLGRVLESHNLDGLAEDALKHSLDIALAQPAIIQHWIALRQRQCKWPAVAGWDVAKSETLMAGISPLSLANITNDPLLQLARGWSYGRDLVGSDPTPLVEIEPSLRQARSKLRIGYVSSDFREHAVGFAMTDVIETHDRNAFEVHAYHCGIEREDETRARIRRGVDNWVDVNDLTDEQAAARIRADEIDILIDLNGYTKNARTRVFALRPAPIVVNWFGFPATMGTPDHHYIIADARIIPPGNELYYSEKVVRLTCYQPNDRKRVVSTAAPSRASEGLPKRGLIYCCLNGSQKFTAPMFAAWMTILAEVDNGVLWLFGGDDDTNQRLRDRARDAGIAPERLIFATKKANPEHLARYALADLFLDTFPYGAHTTAADAMWMGVPVVTLPGRTFASRVCSSLVAAAGVGELICEDRDDYIARAIAIGRDPEHLNSLKRRLREGRSESPLFDTPRLTRELEGAFRSMWRDFLAGERPIPNLTNLEVYQEIGLRLSEREGESGEAYLATYARELARRHHRNPLPADGRAWGGKPEIEPERTFHAV
jgi:predicted O-linked N-acetylglucosamine transferase (SPINDLY family)